jgi:hypothetical protein
VDQPRSSFGCDTGGDGRQSAGEPKCPNQQKSTEAGRSAKNADPASRRRAEREGKHGQSLSRRSPTYINYGRTPATIFEAFEGAHFVNPGEGLPAPINARNERGIPMPWGVIAHQTAAKPTH